VSQRILEKATGSPSGHRPYPFKVMSPIPKVSGADSIEHFQQIFILNVIFKLISKAYAKGRLVNDGALALHEIFHEIKLNNLREIILKLVFKEPYDRVSSCVMYSFKRASN
jgi:hypothetical protein